MIRDRYATIRDAREEGFKPGGDVDDTRLLKLIERASERIRKVVRLRFVPFYVNKLLAGQGNSILSLPEYDQILAIDSLAIRYSDGAENLLDSNDYQIHEQQRWLEAGPFNFEEDELGLPPRSVQGFATSLNLIAGSSRTRRHFPEGPNNFRIKGYFGEVEKTKDVSTTTAGSIAKLANNVELSDASDIELKDMLVIDDAYTVIVEDIVSNTVYFNAAPKAVASGAAVRTFGPIISDEIVVATLMLVKDFLPTINSQEFEDQSFNGRIIRERTDKYEYQLSSQAGVNSGINSTGNAEVDKIIQHFAADTPPFVGYV